MAQEGVWVDRWHGDDKKDGSTVTSAVKTFRRALDLLKEGKAK